MEADALIFLANEDFHFKGAWVEFGIAIARGIPIYVLVGEFTLRNIFLHLPNVRIIPDTYEGHTALFQALSSSLIGSQTPPPSNRPTTRC